MKVYEKTAKITKFIFGFLIALCFGVFILLAGCAPRENKDDIIIAKAFPPSQQSSHCKNQKTTYDVRMCPPMNYIAQTGKY